MKVSTIGLDLAKRVFQVHGVDAAGNAVVRRQLRRNQVLRFFAALEPCLIGIEACAGAHYWGRELQALGHEVRLIPPSYVKPYVKRGKSDAIDAEAICEAVTRPTMRFVPVKSAAQQASLMVHRVRTLLVQQRTCLANSLRAHLAEFGIVGPKGLGRLSELTAMVSDATDPRLPAQARRALAPLVAELRGIDERIGELDREIVAGHKADPVSLQLAQIPGVGPITASAIVATVGDARAFRSGRHLAAWIGLTPRQNASGERAGRSRISKMGDRYLRTLLVLGATAIVARARRRPAPADGWILQLLTRRPARVVALALANKRARTIWAMMNTGEAYRAAA